MKRMKKLLAFLLATMLLLTMIPISASAAPEGQVDFVRLLNTDGWVSAVCKRAGVEPADYYNGFRRLFVYGSDGELFNPTGGGGTIGDSYFYAEIGNEYPDDVERIVLELTIKGKQIVAVFSKSRGDFTVGKADGVAETKYVEISLTETGKARPAGHQVNFMAELNGEVGTYSLYDTIYVTGDTIGEENMPADPPLGEYKFIGWQTAIESGEEFGPDTTVTEDMTVYAAKLTKGEGAALDYRVLRDTQNRPNALYIEVADKYNKDTGNSFGVQNFSIKDISVNGKDDNKTNELYWRNKWKDEGAYYFIYNINSPYNAELTPTLGTPRVEPEDISGITVYGTVDDENFAVTIPRDELSIVEEQLNTTVEISVREMLDGIEKELVTSADGLPFTPGSEITYPDPVDGKVIIPKDGKVTLLYKITVFGDTGSNYIITDDGATVVDGFLKGEISAADGGQAVVYVTKTFGAADITSEDTLSNTAKVAPGEDTYGPDDGNDSAEEEIDAEVEGDEGEGSGTEPDPEEPSIDTVIDILGENAVQVVCVNNEVIHENKEKSYALDKDTFTFESSEINEKSYLVTIEVAENEDVSTYLNKYNEAVGVNHTLFGELKPTTVNVTFTFNDTTRTWSASIEKPLFTIYVTCNDEEEPDPGEDEGPNKEQIIAALGKGAVQVVCDNTNHTDSEKTYDLEEGMFTYTSQKVNVKNDYLVTITLTSSEYLTKYNTDTKSSHTLVATKPDVNGVTFTLEDDTWTADVTYPLFTVTVHCENGGDEPEEPGEPTPPTEEDLEDDPDDSDDPAIFMGDNIVVIDCINPDKTSHTANHYRLFPQTYTIGEVNGDKTSGYTCDITIRPGDYIIVYEQTFPYHGLAEGEDDTKTVTLKWVDDAWTLPENAVPVTFQVTCDTEHIKDTDYIYVEKDPEDPTDPDQTGVSDLLETDDHIQYLFGYPDGSFGPDRNMTRAEAAQMFYNLLKNQNVDAEPAFDDVPDGAWYATPVNVMAELGIVDGVGDDKFEPNREITRAEFTTMAMRFAKVPSGGANIFTDVAPSDWFYSYVVNSIQYGWIEGYGDGTFRPDRLITRAEVTTIVNRMLDRQADMAFVIQNRDKLTKFTDLTTEHWAYYTIVEATNEHNYKKPAIGEDWTSLIK